MDNLPAYLSEIISAAAKSYLGIFALLSISLSVLAYFFFSSASEKVKVSIFVLLFCGVMGFGAAMFSATTPEKASQKLRPFYSNEPDKDEHALVKAVYTKQNGDEILLALEKIGIDFSVEETAIKEWLNNRNTLYPPISLKLLELLKETPLKQPVYMDVIVYNYENIANLPSSNMTAPVDLARLKSAIIMGYNTRYGTDITSFEQLTK